MRPHILLFLFFSLFLSDLAWTEETAEEWFKKGNEAAEAGDYEKAIRCFERTIALDPMHLSGYRNIGCVYGMRGMWDEAIEPFKKALAINPNDAHIRHNLGFCWYKKGILDEAIAEFEKAIALDSEFRDAYHNLAVVYGKKKMFDKAIPMFKEALRIGPNSPDIHFSLGKAYKELGKDILAADHYYKAGMLYLREDYREGALTAYENILPCSQEIAHVFLEKLYLDREASAVTTPLPPEKKVEWHVLLRRMNVREDPSMGSKIIGKIDKNEQFQIIKEAENNDPLYSWYLIRTKSGLSGWLCGIYKGNVKYKKVSKPNFLSFPSSATAGHP
ncbi:MAG: tetratricopeptide repeat protein [Desulfobacterales bacterium]|nr:MAG: tetratricopeptide repeat protein [Desulfobacterales bacterium]